MAPTGGNVQVVARVRPRRTYETDDVAVLAVERPNVIELRVPLLTHPGGGASGIRMPSSSQTRTPPPTSLLAMRSRQRIERYEFDRVFGPESTNDDLAAYVQPVVDAVVRQEKDRATILTYGQTGTGKTYTMLGPMGTSLSTVGDDRPRRWSSNQTATVGQPGVMVKVIERLLAATSRHGGGMAISCSYLEVYNNKLYDLLAKPASDTVRKTHTTLEIREDGEHQLHVLGLRRVPTRSMDDFLALLLQGVQQRAQRATDMNEQSSRSHTILQIHVQFAGTSAVPRSAKICLVDLAGSEKLKKAPQLAAVMRNPAVASGVTSLPSDHMKEFALINQSLSHLGQCIQALLADGCSTKGASKAALHVPFRNCKLTRLLRDSFVSTENAATAGGAAEKQGTGKHHDCRQHRSVVVFILTLAPGLSAMGDSLMTLDFANRIKQIRFTTFGPEQPQPSAPSRPQPKLSRSFSMSMDGRMREAEAATLWRYIHQLEVRNQELEATNLRLEQSLAERQRGAAVNVPSERVGGLLDRMERTLRAHLDEIVETKLSVLAEACESEDGLADECNNELDESALPAPIDLLVDAGRAEKDRGQNSPQTVEESNEDNWDEPDEEEIQDVWEVHVDERTGFQFYHNRRLNASQWHPPPELDQNLVKSRS